MAKTKRGKRSKTRKNRFESPDKPRTCVSPDNIDASQTIFNLVDLITPILTPSPIFRDFDLFQPEKSINLTYKSASRFSPVVQALGNTDEEETSGKNSILNYRTPIKRSLRRSRNYTPRRTIAVNAGENDKSGGENKTQIVARAHFDGAVDVSPMIYPFASISPIHNSTPKIVANLGKLGGEIGGNNGGIGGDIGDLSGGIAGGIAGGIGGQTRGGVSNLSPILRASLRGDYGATKCSIQIERETAPNLNFPPFLRHFQQKSWKYRRFPQRKIQMALFHVYEWIQNAVKQVSAPNPAEV